MSSFQAACCAILASISIGALLGIARDNETAQVAIVFVVALAAIITLVLGACGVFG